MAGNSGDNQGGEPDEFDKARDKFFEVLAVGSSVLFLVFVFYLLSWIASSTAKARFAEQCLGVSFPGAFVLYMFPPLWPFAALLTIITFIKSRRGDDGCRNLVPEDEMYSMMPPHMNPYMMNNPYPRIYD